MVFLFGWGAFFREGALVAVVAGVFAGFFSFDQVLNDYRDPAVRGVLWLVRLTQPLIGVSPDLDNLTGTSNGSMPPVTAIRIVSHTKSRT